MRAAVIPRTYLWVLASFVFAPTLSACKPQSTPITQQSYQTIPLAVDASAKLVHLELVPSNQHGADIWILEADASLGRGILTDPSIGLSHSVSSVAGGPQDNAAEMLSKHSVRVEGNWRAGSAWDGQVLGVKTIDIMILQTDKRTYMFMMRF